VALKPAVEETRVLLVAENGEAGGIGRYCVDLAGVIGPLGEAQVDCLCPAPCGGRCWLAQECERRFIASLGFVVAPRDVDALVGALLSLADHPERARQIGAAASQHVAMHHTLAERVPDMRVPDIMHAYGWNSREPAARSVGGADSQ
jgi:glycosyltransferase involved in cell wall biosynthesis